MTQHPEISLLFIILISIHFSSSIGRNTITPTTPLNDKETLVSDSGSFSLGFFSPNPKSRYIGLWYNTISDKTILWVANRASPLPNSPGILSITPNGTLIIADKDSRVVWSSNTTTKLSNPIAQLLDNGNLVVKELEDDTLNYAWQGFDYPTDTLISDMKFGVDFSTGLNRTMTAWRSPTDPTPGEFVSYMETIGVPEMVMSDDRKRIWRTGPWDGTYLSGVPSMGSYEGFSFSFVSDKSEVTYSFHVDPSIISKLVISPSGYMQRVLWVNESESWNAFWVAPTESCDQIGTCGDYGLCDMSNSLVCNCLTGFVPKNIVNWNKLRDGKDGCVRKHQLDCASGTDGFATVKNVKVPQTENCRIDLSLSLDQCKQQCLTSCNCTAYATANTGNNSGCLIWFGNLFDVRNFQNYGQDLYVRLAAVDVPEDEKSHGGKVVTIVVSVLAAILLLGCAGCFIWWRKKKRKQFLGAITSFNEKSNLEQRGEAIDLPIFDFETIAAATEYFSSVNKLGEGGFGPVYKGKLGDDQEIAVKRLSKTSDQGLEEFKNEVILIAKLQHRNLVRLLGCCIQGEERMLIYEYMSNNSLDAFLFEKKPLLDWNTRYQIIIGIARGLLYLHQDSRLRIIHRDLKAGNILLDTEMKPKISDFGMARIFSGDEKNYNTRKVVGTYGYMSPEYAMDGTFSVKSDVYSFGVLVLEIISGKKNKGVYAKPPHINLLAQAWSLWKEGNSIQLLDGSLTNSYSANEVISCIKIGLLCVQEQPEDRPLMSAVVHMFNSEIISLPPPKQPGFAVKRCYTETLSSSSNHDSWSCDNMTITIVEPR